MRNRNKKSSFRTRKALSSLNNSQKQKNPMKNSNENKNDNNDKSNIMVAIRVRPETMYERAQGRTVLQVLDEKVAVLDSIGNGNIPFSSRKGRGHRYAFDKVFDERTTQNDVYNHTTKFLLDSVVNGFNATVFAYGATGAGKTYTMMGSNTTNGIIALTMKDLFTIVENTQSDMKYRVSISYLEVYNESLRDLLAPESSSNTNHNLTLREDPVKGVTVAGLSQHQPKNVNEVIDLVEQGNQRRTQHGTAANAQSSRSHAVLQISVEQRDRTASIRSDVKMGKLSLIDLAGSERASVTKNRGARLVEGANINRSLLALGNCINALGDPKRQRYVPYRNSKLTRLLKDSLGGNCRTVMIANVTPSSLSYEDTHNTLKYANRAKNIKTKVTRNVVNVEAHVGHYRKIITELRSEISDLKQRLNENQGNGTNKEYEELLAKEQERQRNEDRRKQVASVFQEHAKVRRAIMEVEHLGRQQALETIRKMYEIDRWDREHPNVDEQAVPLMIHTLRRDVRKAGDQAKKNQANKEEMNEVLQKNHDKSVKLQDSILREALNNEAMLSLEHEARVHELEVANLDLERMVHHHHARELHSLMVVDQYQNALKRLHETIVMQNKMMRSHGVSNPEQEKEFNFAHNLIKEFTKNDVDEYPWIMTDNQDIVNALRTPNGLKTTGKSERRLSLGQFRCNNLFPMNIPNSPPDPTPAQSPPPASPSSFKRKLLSQVMEDTSDGSTETQFFKLRSPLEKRQRQKVFNQQQQQFSFNTENCSLPSTPTQNNMKPHHSISQIPSHDLPSNVEPSNSFQRCPPNASFQGDQRSGTSPHPTTPQRGQQQQQQQRSLQERHWNRVEHQKRQKQQIEQFEVLRQQQQQQMATQHQKPPQLTQETTSQHNSLETSRNPTNRSSLQLESVSSSESVDHSHKSKADDQNISNGGHVNSKSGNGKRGNSLCSKLEERRRLRAIRRRLNSGRQQEWVEDKHHEQQILKDQLQKKSFDQQQQSFQSTSLNQSDSQDVSMNSSGSGSSHPNPNNENRTMDDLSASKKVTFAPQDVMISPPTTSTSKPSQESHASSRFKSSHQNVKNSQDPDDENVLPINQMSSSTMNHRPNSLLRQSHQHQQHRQSISQKQNQHQQQQRLSRNHHLCKPSPRRREHRNSTKEGFESFYKKPIRKKLKRTGPSSKETPTPSKRMVKSLLRSKNDNTIASPNRPVYRLSNTLRFRS